MKYIGAHAHIKGGVENAPEEAHRWGAGAFAMFTKSERQWRAAPLKPESIERFKQRCREYGFSPAHILPHDSFLINLGHPEPDGLKKSREAFLDEMRRCEQLGLVLLNFHPGNSLKKSARKLAWSELQSRLTKRWNKRKEYVPCWKIRRDKAQT